MLSDTSIEVVITSITVPCRSCKRVTLPSSLRCIFCAPEYVSYVLASILHLIVPFVGLETAQSLVLLMQVTFLYTLTKGACPKSYGVNVARLAGLPDEVVKRASSFATQLEEQHHSQVLSMPLQLREMQKLQSICQGLRADCISPDLQL